MNQEKPFKTIEVVDARTQQACKVACMSCIRGHRTTSCGIPVCRSKIFWTVKRPGRPSNSCTCRYGATGGCKCVIVKSTCPHKSKKGEKRSGECRCDEQGRYCCVLEPNHWDELLSLQKPTVEFYATRELLETRHTAPASAVVSQTPRLHARTVSYTTPLMSLQTEMATPLQFQEDAYSSFASPSTSLTPRFGMMGIGAPMGSPSSAPTDILAWTGQAPEAPRMFPPPPGVQENQEQLVGSCCQGSPLESFGDGQHSLLSPLSPVQSFPAFHDAHFLEESLRDSPKVNNAVISPLKADESARVFDFNRMQAEYFSLQHPSAICQSCGLSGCTCRNCPPVLQNFGTTGWSNGCGRKHGRDRQSSPSASGQKKLARTDQYSAEIGVSRSKPRHIQSFSCQSGNFVDQEHPHDSAIGLDLQASDVSELGFLIDPPSHQEIPGFEFNPDMILEPHQGELDISEMLVSDLNASFEERAGQNERGHCCGGNT